MCVAPQVHGDEEYWVDPDREAEAPSTPSTPQPSPTSPAPPAATPPAASSAGSPSAGSPSAAPSAASPSAEQPPRIETPPTGIRTGTAPRALLRPVPEGFPTPPPRPAIPNRRPARKVEPEAPTRRRGPIIASLVVVAVLVLVVAIGGSVLVVRALTSPDAGSAAPTQPSAAPTDGSDGSDSSAGATAIGGVEVEVLSTERGVEAVGEGSTRLAAEGEFVIVTLDVSNGTDAPVSLREAADLVTEDGEVHPPSPEAGRVHLADSEPWALLPEGEGVQVHYVFDVPQGSVPVSLELDLRDNPDAGTGTVPLAP